MKSGPKVEAYKGKPGPKPLSLEQCMRSIHLRLDKSGGPTACHTWMGKPGKNGYAYVNFRALHPAPLLVHRLVYEEANGPLDPGIEVCHSCDNPPCSNLAHLFAGTHLENMQDSIAKGRFAIGGDHKRFLVEQPDTTEGKDMAIQHADERLTRADEYMKEAAFVRGMARGLIDLFHHVKLWETGNDPAREVKKIMMGDLKLKHGKALVEAERLEGRAQAIRQLMTPDGRAQAIRQLQESDRLPESATEATQSIDIANEVSKTRVYPPPRSIVADTRMITGLEKLRGAINEGSDPSTDAILEEWVDGLGEGR